MEFITYEVEDKEQKISSNAVDSSRNENIPHHKKKKHLHQITYSYKTMTLT